LISVSETDERKDEIMRLAISTENGMVAAHFGRCPQYTLVDIQDGAEIRREIVENPGHAPGAIPKFLSEKGCDLIIAGGMGRRAQQYFQQFDIDWITGVQGDVDTVIDDFISNNLATGESTCDHGEGKGTGYRDCH
jgi:predicted Fe-Mo cluster-binding NifX family protein